MREIEDSRKAGEYVVAIVDDDAAIREAIIMVLESVGIRARGYPSAQSFLASGESTACHCLVMDVRMPGLSGIEAFRRLRDSGEHLPVIFITGHGDIEMAVDVMKLGAVDFLGKPFRDQTLIDAVQAALRRNDRPALANGGQALAMDPAREAVLARVKALTPREREVMVRVARGLRSKQIAADLDISLKTVEEYRSRILQKMEAGTSCELTAMVSGLALDEAGNVR